MKSDPTTLTEVVDMIIAGMSPESIEVVKQSPPENFHHGFGTDMRNNLGLWDTNRPISIWFQKHLELSHGDDLSGIIMKMTWAKVRNEFFDPFAEAERYHKHWRGFGIDPLTQKKL